VFIIVETCQNHVLLAQWYFDMLCHSVPFKNCCFEPRNGSFWRSENVVLLPLSHATVHGHSRLQKTRDVMPELFKPEGVRDA
jgi:hypothetical protein